MAAIDFDPDQLSIQGWYALAAEFQDDTVTLLSWLLGQHESDAISCSSKITKTLDLLLLKRLSQVYQQASSTNNLLNAPNLYRHELDDHARLARVLASIDELKPMLEKYGKINDSNSWDEQLIDRFLHGKEISGTQFHLFPSGAYQCVSHGDLHTRNIMVGEHTGDPKIVDLGNVQLQAPRGFDIARLTADIILSGLGRGVNSYEWEAMPNWLAAVGVFLADEKLPELGDPQEANFGCYVALNWLQDNYAQIFGDQHPMPFWEYQLALAVEFLLASYRLNAYSAPKRVLALLSACIALRECGGSIARMKS